MSCDKCPDRLTCTEICEDMEKDLPSMYTGQGWGGRGEPLNGSAAIIRLWKDGKDVKEIAYHVPLNERQIQSIIRRHKMGSFGG